MKRKLLFLLPLLALTACGTKEASSSSQTASSVEEASSTVEASSENSSVEVSSVQESSIEEPDLQVGTVLKKAADDIFDYLGATRTPSSSLRRYSFDPLSESECISDLNMPAILLYLTGQIAEFGNDIDLTTNMYNFMGDYEFNYSSDPDHPDWHAFTVTMFITIDLDVENNKIVFYGRERVLDFYTQDLMDESPMYIDMDFDFENNELGDFKLFTLHGSSLVYDQVVDGTASKLGSHATDQERAAVQVEFDALDATCEERYNNHCLSLASYISRARQAFVNTQEYANGLFGQPAGVRIKGGLA